MGENFKKINILVFALLFVLLLPTFAFANEEGNIAIRALNHPKQDQSDLGYISINNENRDQTIKNISFQVTNKSKETKKVKAEVQNMYSYNFSYLWNTSETEKYSMVDERYNLREYIKENEKEIFLKAGEAKNVSFDITGLPKGLDGQIFGSVIFSEVSKPNKSTKKNTISSKSKVQVGVLINQDYNNSTINNIEVNSIGVKEKNGQNHYVIEVKNPNPYIMKNSFNLNIKDDEGEVITQDEIPFSLTPKSSFFHYIPLKLERETGETVSFPEGNYEVNLKGEKISFKQKFELIEEKTDKVEDKQETKKQYSDYEFKKEKSKAVEIQKSILRWLGILIALNLLVLILLLLFAKRKSKKEDEKKETPETIETDHTNTDEEEE